MKSEKIRLIVLQISLLIFLLFTIIYNNVISKKILAIVLLVFMVIFAKVVKNDKLKSTNSRQVLLLLTAFGVSYIAIIYIMGIFTGFYVSTVKFSLWSIKNYIIPYIVIIISTEIIRKRVLLKENKISNILILIITIIIDVITKSNISGLEKINDYFILLSFVIFSSIANNLLFNYIIVKYRNEKATIIYRIITTLYVYIIPIIPDIYIFFESVIQIIVPYIIYNILERIYNRKVEIITVSKKRKSLILSIITLIIVVFIVMLISCKFTYGALVIGSGSMTGTINKGDIIIYKKYDKNQEITKGEIIVFKKDDIKVVHRVIDIKKMGADVRYYTKGDANNSEDEGYREKDQIIGQVKFKIKYIGYLTLFVNDMININN